MSYVYLLAILCSAVGVGAIDARWRLALFANPSRALLAVFGTSLVLLIFDLAAIASGSFIMGSSPWMTGIEVVPHLPIEELAFVIFFSYVSLVAVAGASRVIAAVKRDNS